MGLIREPKNVDFTVESKPWTEQELADFRKLMKQLKTKKTSPYKARNKSRVSLNRKSKKKQGV
jgi:hypothetical protein